MKRGWGRVVGVGGGGREGVWSTQSKPRFARPSIDGRLSNTASAPLLALFNVLGPGGLD